MQFYVNGIPYGSAVSLNAEGKANKQLPYTALWIGEHQISARYSGDEYFDGSEVAGGPLLQKVEKGLLIITLEPTVLNPVYGQEIAFSATVAGNGANNPRPTGTVQFKIDGEDLGSPVTLDEQSSALSQAISSLPVGEHTLGLAYSGDGHYQPAEISLPEGVSVSKANTALEYTVKSYKPAVTGEPVTFSIEMSAESPGDGQPTGTVTIGYSGGSCSAEATEGSCRLIPDYTSPADSLLTFEYKGDENFLPAKLNVLNGPAIEPADTELSITGTSPSTVVTGQPYTVSIQTAPLTPSTLIPVGRSVTITNGEDSCIAVVQLDGSAQSTLTPSSTSEQVLTATLDGGEHFLDQTSEPVLGPEVKAARTAVTLTTSSNPVIAGEAVQFKAYVQSIAPGSGVPSRKVQFKIDGQVLGGPVELINGIATSPEKRDLEPGLHQVTALFQGDQDFEASASAPLSQNTVTGDQGVVVPPGEKVELVITGEQEGQPVEMHVTIPAGSVEEDMMLVFHRFENSSLLPPAGRGFLMNFTIDAYVNGELQQEVDFLQPLTITIQYNPKNLKEESLTVLSWNGSEWSSDGITILNRDPDANTITFTLSSSQVEFSLAGTREYINLMPILRLGSG